MDCPILALARGCGTLEAVFDSHCHLHDARMIAHADEAIARAKAVGVRGFMLAGVSPDGWRTELELNERHPECAVSYGVHPQLCGEEGEATLLAMLDELGRAVRAEGWPRPAALGEVGLDRSTPALKHNLPLQERLFREQLALAREVALPVILHILHAHGRALEILKQDALPAAGGVVHSYSGPAELVPDYEALGLHVSFTGIVCQPNARRARAAALKVSAERLLVETDSPDQTPLPYRSRGSDADPRPVGSEFRRGPTPNSASAARGAPTPLAFNEPAFLTTVVEEIARLRGETATLIAERTENNARRLFGL